MLLIHADRLGRKRPGIRALLFWCALAALAGISCGPGAAPVTIRAGLLLDGRGGERRDALITVVNHRILSVASYPGGPVTHDLTGYTILPGLIDAHVHVSGFFSPRLGQPMTELERDSTQAALLLATLRAGFTTVASMGSESERTVRDAIAAGRLPGPRVLTSLEPIRAGSFTPLQLRKRIRRLRAQGADFVKIFAAAAVTAGGAPDWRPEQLAALCQEARRVGLRSVVHVQSDASIRAAAAAGCDQAEHGFLATGDGMGALARRGLAFDPQCRSVIANYLENRPRLEGRPGFGPREYATMERLLPVLPRLIGVALATPGLPVLYGTDATAGAHGKNAEDLVCRVREAGEPPMDALVSATSRNAAAYGLGSTIGSIAPGFEADIIALEGNPLEEIEAVRRVRFVMKGGVVYHSALSR